MVSPTNNPSRARSASGLEAVNFLLKKQEIHRPPPDTIPSEGGGYTWSELKSILERVGIIDFWPSDRLSRSESWSWLVEKLPSPVMVALETEWGVALEVRKDTGTILLLLRGSLQEMRVDHFCELWDQAGNMAVNLSSLKRDVVSRFDYLAYIPQTKLVPTAGFMDAYPDPPEEIADTVRLYERFGPIQVTEWNVRLIGKMFCFLSLYQNEERWYWQILKKGGVPGYELYVHELVRMGWCFEGNIDPCSEESTKFWNIEHVLSLITSMRLLQEAAIGRVLQSVARRSETPLTICELVLANSLTHDREEDWSAIVRFDAIYPFLRPEDSRARPQRILEAWSWYRENGYPSQPQYRLMRNLESVARWSQRNFSLRELTLANPLSTDPESDWSRIEQLNIKTRGHFLRAQDCVARPDTVELVRQWYGEDVYIGRPFR